MIKFENTVLIKKHKNSDARTEWTFRKKSVSSCTVVDTTLRPYLRILYYVLHCYLRGGTQSDTKIASLTEKEKRKLSFLR